MCIRPTWDLDVTLFFFILHHARSGMNVSCGTLFQVKINQGAPIQIVHNGLTIRHPALPPVPESPPQPLPPLNFDVFTTPALPTPFGSPTQQRFPAASPSIFADGPYHNLFKREKGGSKKRDVKNETAMTGLTETKKSVAKRETSMEAGGTDDKVIKSRLNRSRAGVRFRPGVNALRERPSEISLPVSCFVHVPFSRLLQVRWIFLFALTR